MPRVGRTFLWTLPLVLVAACGGGGDGNANAADTTPPQAAVEAAVDGLERSQPITIRFSESMDVSSLRLGGSLGAESVAAWSRDSADNDTLTLTARSAAWPAGAGQKLVVDARDVSGNALPTLVEEYLVRLRFEQFQAASIVIGQADFQGDQANAGGIGANTVNRAYGNAAVAPDGKVFLADYGNNRVLVFSGIPNANNGSARFVLGQPDFVQTTPGTSQNKFSGPQSPSIAAGRLAVTEYDNSRVLIYDGIPSDGSAIPSIVLGQADFNSLAARCAPVGMNSPESSVLTEDGKILVTDSNNNRVLIWNRVPATSGQPPDLVLGQSDANHCQYNDDDQDDYPDVAPTARTMSYPAGIWSDGRRLVVLDESNNRALIWNTFPTANFQPADIVLGQSTFGGKTPNDDDQDDFQDPRPTARTFAYPYDGVSSNGVQLAISDAENHRILIWNTFPTSSFQPADLVIGHGTFSWGVENDTDEDRTPDLFPSAQVLRSPSGAFFHQDRLIVTDTDNHRFLVFRSR